MKAKKLFLLLLTLVLVCSYISAPISAAVITEPEIMPMYKYVQDVTIELYNDNGYLNPYIRVISSSGTTYINGRISLLYYSEEDGYYKTIQRWTGITDDDNIFSWSDSSNPLREEAGTRYRLILNIVAKKGSDSEGVTTNVEVIY